MVLSSPGSLIERVRGFFEGRGREMAAVYVFGSVGRGTDADTSDVDVAVLFDREPVRTLEGLHTALADELQSAIGKRVDLVVLNHASADLVHRILKDGILVNEGNRSARIAFEVSRRNEYFDLAPVRQRYRQAAVGAVAS